LNPERRRHLPAHNIPRRQVDHKSSLSKLNYSGTAEYTNER
jgi:hypothetical protein